MYSLNAPVPSQVAALARDLAADLPAARPRARGTHTLVVKRLGTGTEGFARVTARVREVLADVPPCAARVTAVDVFEDVATGTAPVVYLRVESPGLEALHERLCTVFDPVDGLEGDSYVLHVTVARGGSIERARDLASREVDPIEWIVDELVFWDAKNDQSVGRVSLG